MAPPPPSLAPLSWDSELLVPLKANGYYPTPPPPATKETIGAARDMVAPLSAPENIFTDPAITYRDMTIPGPDSSNPNVTISILETTASATPNSNPAGKLRPGIFYVHGGGQILGTRHFLIAPTFPWIKELDAVLVTPEYRLSPESKHPNALHDCYAALAWLSTHTRELGIDPSRVMIAGHSAGGGLAAGLALLARDRKLDLKLAAQLLVYPMLDDRMTSISCKQFDNAGTWTGRNNKGAWEWIVGPEEERERVKWIEYAAPARMEDLSRLPTSWVEVGTNETFRDEAVEYAGRLWRAGVQCELHAFAGAFHGYDVFGGDTEIGRLSLQGQLSWLRRVMGTGLEAKKVPAAL
ncbi:Alpha/Beta hydrolase protein [Tricladium varicosporioides]|nr:Alpha/Beta hydrolase protein [Hymenoscyphus varicosporioides]